MLFNSFTPSKGDFQFVTHKNIVDTADIQPFFQGFLIFLCNIILYNTLIEAVSQQCEGLMVKTLRDESQYEPARRSYNWLKALTRNQIRKSYLGLLVEKRLYGGHDRLLRFGSNCGVVRNREENWSVHFFYCQLCNQGKRFGAYLIACYDEDSEQFQAMTKVIT